ncbi:MAG: alpha/beta hydrolase, partial [Verrucomicrobiae bacterium]|nr:alpha/beta hydrolase [Verrucomicrobiae bacterium]
MKTLLPFSFLVAALVQLGPLSRPAQAEPAAPVTLWHEGVPDEAGLKLPEETREEKNNDGIWRVGNVSQPTYTVYPAPADKNTGAAVVVCPGGGYNILAITHEGEQVCEWLNSLGVTGVLLKYRVPRREGKEKHHAPLQDVQRAISLVRGQAETLKIDPKRIGVLGFSAGGHLATMALTAYDAPRTYLEKADIDRVSCKPDFGILVYPAYLKSETNPNELSPEIKVTKETPPVFMVVAHGDKSFVEGSPLLYLALQRAGASGELHVFAKGGHGFGMKEIGEEVQNWPTFAGNWMRTMGFLGDLATKSEVVRAHGHPPVGVVKAANYEITLHTSQDGPRYSIKDANVNVVAKEINRATLAAEFPELNQDLRGLWAG